MQEMNLFGGIEHAGDEDLDTLPPVGTDASEIELLDYIVLVMARFCTCDKAFKGGYMLNRLLEGHSRLTHDVDFSVGTAESYEKVKTTLRCICEKFAESGYIADYRIKDTITPTSSGGVDMYSADGQKILGVDVGLHDLGYGLRRYEFAVASVDGFTVERMLADKLIAITTRKRFRRTKDLYDFYAITNFFDVNMQLLSECVVRRGGAEWEHIPFNDAVLEQYKHAWDKLQLNGFGDSVIVKPEFTIALERYYAFALPLKYNDYLPVWEHEYGRFWDNREGV